MNIFIVGTAYPLRGGIAHFNALLASHLAARHNVTTITFKRQYPSLLFPGKSQEESGEPAPGLVPAPQLIDSINPLNWLAVARTIRSQAPDLLIFKYWLPFFGPCFGTIAKYVKKSTAAKVLFICDNIIPHERRPGDILFTRYAFRQADYFIVQSDAVERELTGLFPGSVYRKVPHPVYENFGAAIEKEPARRMLRINASAVLLYFGYVRAYKGLLVLLEAMPAILESNKDLLLLIVGEFYDDEKKYRDRAHELGIEHAVRFVSEYVPNGDVGKYFSAADAVVLPYRSATQSGIAQIAYNFDKPIIATAVGGLSEVVVEGKTGYLVPPEQPAALAGAICRFYRERREIEFAANVRIVKKKYTWNYLIQNIEELTQL